MSAPACINCQFWQPKEAAAPYPHCNGWCRRYAPQGPVVKMNGAGWQLFPPMNSDQWCGDYRPSTHQLAPQAAQAAAA